MIDEDEEKVTHTLNACIQTLTGSSVSTPSTSLKLRLFHVAFVYAGDHKASEDLHSFAKSNENRLYKLLKTCFNTQTDIKTLAKSSVGPSHSLLSTSFD